MDMSIFDSSPLSNCTICVLTHNRKEQLCLTLSNIREEFGEDFINVVVLNNGSSDSTTDFLNQLSGEWPQLKVVHSNENLGCAMGREITWKEAPSDYILSMDDDIIVERCSLLAMLHILREENGAGIVSPIIIDSVSGRTLNPIAGNSLNADFFYEGCFLIRASLIHAIGYLDPVLAIAGEGLDYSIRARKAGFSIVRSPGARVLHVDRVRDADQTMRRRQDWLWSFSYLYWKNYSPPVALILSIRIFVAHVASAFPLYGWGFCLSLPRYAVSGAMHGRRFRV